MVLPSADCQHEDPNRSIYDLDSHFLDFDPIKEWLVDPDINSMPHPDILNDSGPLESRNAELGYQDPILEPSIDERMEKVSLVESTMDPSGYVDGKNRKVPEANSVEVGDGEAKNDGVSEVCSVSDPIMVAKGSDEEDSSEVESEESSSESSSSSSSSSDEDDVGESSSSNEEEEEEDGDVEEKLAAAVEVEEGEINGDDLDELILGSDGEEAVPKGPIKSKHEIEDLPPVPPLEVSLEPRHQTLPVGFVSSILGNRVIVEGSEKHSPLNEGSILWISETRMPLGIIDELFGPVKNPYYIVRYNSDKEVPSGISIGVAVSFVVDFANHILLNESYLYHKGYDASGVDDEEITDEVEFSDDEKEAEYKRSLRQNKRDANHENQESGFGKGKRKTNFKGAGTHKGKPLPSQPRQVVLPAEVNNCDSSQGAAHVGNVASSPTMVPSFPSQTQAFQMGGSGCLGNTSQQFNTVSTQGFLPQPHPTGIQGGGSAPQPSSVGMQGGFPAQAQPTGVQGGFPPQLQPTGMQGAFPPQLQAMGMQGAFASQSQFMTMQGGLPMNWLPAQQFGNQIANLHHQNQVLNVLASGVMPYQQQLVPNFGALPGNFPWFFGSANPSNGPSPVPVALMGQGGFGQVPFGCGNMNPQGIVALGNEQSHGQAPPAVNQGEMRPPSMQFNGNQFNPGRSSSRGRRPYQRGGHRSFGHRGGSQQNG